MNFHFIHNVSIYSHRLSIYDTNINNLYNLTDGHYDAAYMAISQVVDYFNFLNFPKVNILKTKDYVQQLSFCIYFKKHSCLLKPFNNQIEVYRSSGLIDFWAKSFLKVHQLKNQNEHVYIQTKPLALSQFGGVITICAYFTGASVILFIFELMSNRQKGIKKILDFLSLKKDECDS